MEGKLLDLRGIKLGHGGSWRDEESTSKRETGDDERWRCIFISREIGGDQTVHMGGLD